jgi:glycosyltransferase involved in cell wall biosynthesis
VVTYEGVDESIKSKKDSHILERYHIKKPFLLYVGNVYPHKNIEKLIGAVKRLAEDYRFPVSLVVVCARSVFWERLKKKVGQLGAEKYVNLAGFVPDEELAEIYRQAKVYVFPTLSEGFGLPGLEAMAQGLPVAASDIPVLREIYKDSVLYFDPHDSKDMAEKIKKLLTDKKLQEKLKKQGLALIKNYSWGKMAQETLLVYQKAIE